MKLGLCDRVLTPPPPPPPKFRPWTLGYVWHGFKSFSVVSHRDLIQTCQKLHYAFSQITGSLAIQTNYYFTAIGYTIDLTWSVRKNVQITRKCVLSLRVIFFTIFLHTFSPHFFRFLYVYNNIVFFICLRCILRLQTLKYKPVSIINLYLHSI